MLDRSECWLITFVRMLNILPAVLAIVSWSSEVKSLPIEACPKGPLSRVETCENEIKSGWMANRFRILVAGQLSREFCKEAQGKIQFTSSFSWNKDSYVVNFEAYDCHLFFGHASNGQCFYDGFLSSNGNNYYHHIVQMDSSCKNGQYFYGSGQILLDSKYVSMNAWSDDKELQREAIEEGKKRMKELKSGNLSFCLASAELKFDDQRGFVLKKILPNSYFDMRNLKEQDRVVKINDRDFHSVDSPEERSHQFRDACDPSSKIEVLRDRKSIIIAPFDFDR